MSSLLSPPVQPCPQLPLQHPLASCDFLCCCRWIQSFERPNLYFSVRMKDSNPTKNFPELMEAHRNGEIKPTIIYTITRKFVARPSVVKFNCCCFCFSLFPPGTSVPHGFACFFALLGSLAMPLGIAPSQHYRMGGGQAPGSLQLLRDRRLGWCSALQT